MPSAVFYFSTKIMVSLSEGSDFCFSKMDQNGSQGDFVSVIHWDVQGCNNRYLIE